MVSLFSSLGNSEDGKQWDGLIILSNSKYLTNLLNINVLQYSKYLHIFDFNATKIIKIRQNIFCFLEITILKIKKIQSLIIHLLFFSFVDLIALVLLIFRATLLS